MDIWCTKELSVYISLLWSHDEDALMGCFVKLSYQAEMASSSYDVWRNPCFFIEYMTPIHKVYFGNFFDLLSEEETYSLRFMKFKIGRQEQIMIDLTLNTMSLVIFKDGGIWNTWHVTKYDIRILPILLISLGSRKKSSLFKRFNWLIH